MKTTLKDMIYEDSRRALIDRCRSDTMEQSTDLAQM